MTSTKKVNALTSIGDIQTGDKLVGERVDGTTVRITYTASSGAVDSVNGHTGTVVLNADDISDTATTNKYVTSAEKTKLSNLSGTNTGDQTISLTGDVTGSGTGSFSATIANSAVTYAKIQNVSATDKLLGRSSIGAGVVEEIALTSAGRALIDDADAPAQRTTLGLGTLATQSGTFSGTSSGTNTGDQTITLTGDVTGSGTGSFAATIANSAVTLAKQADMATASVVYRKTAGAGAPEVNTLATLKTDLGLTGTNSGDQTITLTGDVTGSGTGSFAATLATPGSVTVDTADKVLIKDTSASDVYKYVTAQSVANLAAGGAITGTANQIVNTAGTLSIASNPVIPGTTGMVLPQGSTAGRGSAGTFGRLRGNTSTGFLEYDNGGWVLIPSVPETLTSRSIPVFSGSNSSVMVNTSATVDANGNVYSNNLLPGYTSTATAAGTTTLTVASTNTQIFTGSTTQTCVLPVVSTLTLGTTYTIVNLSSGVVTVQSSGTNTIQAMQANSTLVIKSNATTGTGATVWHVVDYSPAASGQTGSGSLVRATSPTFVTPVLGAASATSISFSSTSGVIGTATNDNAASGSVGELVTNTTAANSTSLTTGTIADCCTVSLTAGDWDIYGTAAFFGGSTTQPTFFKAWTSASSVTDPGGSLYMDQFLAAAQTPFATAPFNLPVPFLRVSLSGSATVYLSVQVLFTISTCTAGGTLYARRRR